MEKIQKGEMLFLGGLHFLYLGNGFFLDRGRKIPVWEVYKSVDEILQYCTQSKTSRNKNTVRNLGNDFIKFEYCVRKLFDYDLFKDNLSYHRGQYEAINNFFPEDMFDEKR